MLTHLKIIPTYRLHHPMILDLRVQIVFVQTLQNLLILSCSQRHLQGVVKSVEITGAVDIYMATVSSGDGPT